jgi:DNA-binding NarL/FixJ family response regulator
MFRVLVVDDSRRTADGIAEQLREEADMSVIGAVYSGRDAVTFAWEHLPDIVLMDLNMDGMGGIEATTRICADLPSVKVIVVTGCDDDEHLFGAFKAGASGYIVKGATAEEIAQCIRDLGRQVVFLPPSLSLRVIAEFNRVANQDRSKGSPYLNLTPQEVVVLQLIAANKTNRQIADKLFVEPGTVRNHVTKILHKLAANSRVEAAQIGIQRGIIRS